jgi:hypothetical protein
LTACTTPGEHLQEDVGVVPGQQQGGDKGLVEKANDKLKGR